MFGICLRQKPRKQFTPHSTAISESTGTAKHHALLLKKGENNSISDYIYLIEFLLSCDMEQMFSISQEAALAAEMSLLLFLWKSAPNLIELPLKE